MSAHEALEKGCDDARADSAMPRATSTKTLVQRVERSEQQRGQGLPAAIFQPAPFPS
jgi:hypothetical protein